VTGVAAAKALGLEVVSDTVTYQVDTTDFTPVLLPVIQTAPDLLVLSGVSPANAPQLIRSARELGYTGLISTETAQDAPFWPKARASWRTASSRSAAPRPRSWPATR
jgi:branched-chain amino acid transport system substrate-binding protein